MKVLVTGGIGLSGAKLTAALSREHAIAGTCLSKVDNDCRFLDVTGRSQLYTILSGLRPDIVIHTAAISDSDFCESDKKETSKVHIMGTRNVAVNCEALNAKLLYI